MWRLFETIKPFINETSNACLNACLSNMKKPVEITTNIFYDSAHCDVKAVFWFSELGRSHLTLSLSPCDSLLTQGRAQNLKCEN